MRMFRAENGFCSIVDHFPNGKALHVPLHPASPEFTVDGANELLSVQSYRRFESALDSLPTPTVLICKTNRRASAVLMAYLVRLLHFADF